MLAQNKKYFGLVGDRRARWCKNCPNKPVDAVDIKSRRCTCPNSKHPTFGLESDRQRKWCARCPKPAEAINLVSRWCKECKQIQVNAIYKPYCTSCFFHKHPEITPPKVYRTRENHLFNRVMKDFPGVFRYDVPIQGGCSKKKPDLFVDLGSHVLHGKNDEHGDNHRGNQCENKRMMELSQTRLVVHK